jgi:hypothetical protein
MCALTLTWKMAVSLAVGSAWDEAVTVTGALVPRGTSPGTVTLITALPPIPSSNVTVVMLGARSHPGVPAAVTVTLSEGCCQF